MTDKKQQITPGRMVTYRAESHVAPDDTVVTPDWPAVVTAVDDDDVVDLTVFCPNANAGTFVARAVAPAFADGEPVDGGEVPERTWRWPERV